MSALSALSLDEIALQAVEKDVQLAKLPLRAKRKIATQTLSERLVDLCPRSIMLPAYHEAHDCAHRLLEYEKVIRAWGFCHRRICTVCASIRQSHLINCYHLDQLPAPHFLTLSARNVEADRLVERIREYEAVWRKNLELIRQRARRSGSKSPVSGLRKLEVTYNDSPGRWRGTYHPHYHVVISGRQEAELLRDLWLACWGEEASHLAQDVRACDENTMTEMTKYETKLAITANPDSDDVVRAIDVIVKAIHGKRTIQPFGGFRKVEDSYEEQEHGEVIANWEWRYDKGLWLPNNEREDKRRYGFDREKGGFKKLGTAVAAPAPHPEPSQLRLFDSKEWIWIERDGR